MGDTPNEGGNAIAAVLLIMAILVIIAAVTVAGCRPPPPDSTLGRVIRCSSPAVQKCWPSVLPSVNTCAASENDGVACLVGLIRPVGCLAEDVIACVARRQGAEFNHAAQANPDDARSARAAATLATFVRQRGYIYDVDPAH